MGWKANLFVLLLAVGAGSVAVFGKGLLFYVFKSLVAVVALKQSYFPGPFHVAGISPEANAFASILRSGRPPFVNNESDALALRELSDAARHLFPIVDPAVATETVRLTDVSGVIYTPPKLKGGRALLHFHGGAYCIGTPQAEASSTARVALLTGAKVLSVDYGLFPPYTVWDMLDHAVDGYRYLLSNGFPPSKIGVFGCSAGASMTVMMLVELKRRGLDLPAAAIAASLPSVGDSLAGKRETWPSWESAKTDRDSFFTAEWIANFTQFLYADPKFGFKEAFVRTAENLENLPPIMLTVGSEEFLFTPAQAVADRIKEHGGEVVWKVYEGMQHCPALYYPHFPESIDAVQEMADFFLEHIR